MKSAMIKPIFYFLCVVLVAAFSAQWVWAETSAEPSHKWFSTTLPDSGSLNINVGTDSTFFQTTAEIQMAQATEGKATSSGGHSEDLGNASQTFANPIAQNTLFIMETDFLFLNGDASSKTRHANILIIEPIIPYPLGDSGWTLINRPILPFGFGATIPVGQGGGDPITGIDFQSRTGVGDLTFFSLLTPPNDGNGFLYGVGPTLKFPTASDDKLGSEKWSAGPAGIVIYSSKKFTVGTLIQQWWSYAGAGSRDEFNQLSIQYIAFYNFNPQWGLGMTPIITANHGAEKYGDIWAVPVGLGVTHTFKLGKIPSRVLLEGQYYVIQRDTYGPVWNFKINFAMFLPPLFGK